MRAHRPAHLTQCHDTGAVLSFVCVTPGCARSAPRWTSRCESCARARARNGDFLRVVVGTRGPRNPHGTAYVAALVRAIEGGADLEGVDAREVAVIQHYRRSREYAATARGRASRARYRVRRREEKELRA